MNIKVIKPLNDYKKEFIKKDILLLIGIISQDYFDKQFLLKGLGY